MYANYYFNCGVLPLYIRWSLCKETQLLHLHRCRDHHHNNYKLLNKESYCYQKIGTPMFWHPVARIHTPILILRDPTHDILPKNWNPRKQTTVPGVLSRNVSPYQKAVMSRWFIIQQIEDGARVSHQCRGEWLGETHLWWGTWVLDATSSISSTWESWFQT